MEKDFTIKKHKSEKQFYKNKFIQDLNAERTLNISDKLIKLKAQKQLLDEQQSLNEKIETLKKNTKVEEEKTLKSVDEIISTP